MDAKDSDLASRFSAQVKRYVDAGYPRFAGISVDDFRSQVDPLRSKIPADIERATDVPLLLVVRSELVSAQLAMSSVAADGEPGYVDMTPSEPAAFDTIEDVLLPEGRAYLLLDVSYGDSYRNLPPKDALPRILAEGRSPLTIDEGVSLLVQEPRSMEHRHFFSMLASRSSAKGVAKSVPAVWISKGSPRLGWCWNGNPHTWLGSASCGGRVGP